MIKLPSDDSILDWIGRNPRSTVTEAARAFGLAPPFLRPLFASLRERGKVFAEGRTRGVRYYIPSRKERRERAYAEGIA